MRPSLFDLFRAIGMKSASTPVLFVAWIALIAAMPNAWPGDSKYPSDEDKSACTPLLVERQNEAQKIKQQLSQLQKPTGVLERLHYYGEKLSLAVFDEDGQLKRPQKPRWWPEFSIGQSLQDLLPYLNPLSRSDRAKNHTLDGKDGHDGDVDRTDEDKEDDRDGGGKVRVVGEFNRPGITYFRRTVYQDLYFRSGKSENKSILTNKQRVLPLGISSAKMAVENVLPRRAFELPIPEGFRLIPQPTDSPVKVWRDGSDHYFFRSNKSGKAIVHFSEDRATDLSRIERQTYTTVYEPIALAEWPGNFGILLRALVEHVKERRHSLSTLEIAAATRSLIQSHLLYSRSKSNAGNTLEMILEGRCQCSWAAVMTVGIMRQYFGTPARVAVGDTGKGKEGVSDRSYILRSNALHAWAEVYEDADSKWHIVDSTPIEQEAGQARDSAFWNNILAGLQMGAGFLGQKDSGFYDIAPQSDRSSALADFFAQWGTKMQSKASAKTARASSSNSPLFDFNFDFPDFFGKWFSQGNDSDGTAFDLEASTKAAREARIQYALVQILWQDLLEEATNSSHDFAYHLLFLTKHFGTQESRYARHDDKKHIATVYKYFRKKAETLLSRFVAIDIQYDNTGELGKKLESDSETERARAASFIVLLYQQLNNYRTLDFQEQSLLRSARGIYFNSKTLDGVEDQQKALFSELSLRGKPVAVDYELKKMYGSASNVDYNKFWDDYHSGKLDRLLDFIRQSAFMSEALSYPEAKRNEVSDLVPVPVSDHDEDIGQAEDLARYGNFIRKGYGYKYDIFRFTSGLMEEKQYKNYGDHVREANEPVLTAVLLTTSASKRVDHFVLALRMVAAAILHGENIALVTAAPDKELKVFWRPDEMLSLNTPPAWYPGSSYEHILKQLNPDQIHVINLIQDPENEAPHSPPLAFDGRREDWYLLNSILGTGLLRADDDEVFMIPHELLSNADTLKEFKRELQQNAFLYHDDKIPHWTMPAFLDPSPSNVGLRGGDLTQWKHFTRIVAYKARTWEDIEVDPKLSEFLKEWEGSLQHMIAELNLDDEEATVVRARAMLRFSELVMKRKLSSFASGLPKSLLRDFIRDVQDIDPALERAYKKL